MGKVSGFLHFTKSFPTEESCIKYYEKLRWNGKVVSPFDKDSKVYKCSNGRYRCANTSDMAWNKFKQLCNSQKYKEAYEFYKRDQGDILVSLSHSSSRYTFLAEMLKPLMSHYETPDSMAVKYLEAIELEYQLQSATIKLSGEESYVPEVYPFTIIEYGRALNKVGRQGEATNLVEELKDATLFLTEDAMGANFTVTMYLALLLDDSGDSEAAVNLFKSFKNDVLMWKSEDAGQEGAEEYYNDYLRMIDDRIEQFSI